MSNSSPHPPSRPDATLIFHIHGTTDSLEIAGHRIRIDWCITDSIFSNVNLITLMLVSEYDTSWILENNRSLGIRAERRSHQTCPLITLSYRTISATLLRVLSSSNSLRTSPFFQIRSIGRSRPRGSTWKPKQFVFLRGSSSPLYLPRESS